LAIHGKLAVVTARAQIPGARQFHFTQRGENAPRAQFAVVRLIAAWAGDGALIGGGLAEPQQLTQGRCSGLMQGGTEGHLHRLQIQVAGLLALGEDTAQQRGYFARDLGVDRRGRFFPSGVNVSSTGRNAQIFSLTSTISPLSF
jgi:hypothetical protein